MSYHVRPIVIGVCKPAASICWERQLKGCNPFIAINVSLCINSTNCKQISKVNLQPLVITVICPWAPAVSSVTSQPAEPWPVIGFPICGTGCHLNVRNYLGVWNSDGARQTSDLIFWMQRKNARIIYGILLHVRESWFICIAFFMKERKISATPPTPVGGEGYSRKFYAGRLRPRSILLLFCIHLSKKATPFVYL